MHTYMYIHTCIYICLRIHTCINLSVYLSVYLCMLILIFQARSRVERLAEDRTLSGTLGLSVQPLSEVKDVEPETEPKPGPQSSNGPSATGPPFACRLCSDQPRENGLVVGGPPPEMRPLSAVTALPSPGRSAIPCRHAVREKQKPHPNERGNDARNKPNPEIIKTGRTSVESGNSLAVSAFQLITPSPRLPCLLVLERGRDVS